MLNHLLIAQETASISRMCKFLKSKLKRNCKTKTESTSIDDFIIKHVQNNTNNDNKINIDSFDQRRIVFISLIGLYKTWKNVPSLLLYSSLLCIPLNQKWIYNPTEHIKEIQSRFISQLSIFTDVAEINQFIQLLKWKDSQGLVIWMLDNHKINTIQPMIHSFWHNLSDKLENLYDPLTQRKYKPLNLNTNKEDRLPILDELYHLTMQYITMKAIISESNPNSLRPVISYLNDTDCDKVTNISMKKLTNQQLLHLYDDQDINLNITVHIKQKEDVWFIAEDY